MTGCCWRRLLLCRWACIGRCFDGPQGLNIQGKWPERTSAILVNVGKCSPNHTGSHAERRHCWSVVLSCTTKLGTYGASTGSSHLWAHKGPHILNTRRTKRWNFRFITMIVWAARAAQPLTTHWKLSRSITNNAKLGLCSTFGRRTAIWNGDPFTRCSSLCTLSLSELW
jgi:hypothetical protein